LRIEQGDSRIVSPGATKFGINSMTIIHGGIFGQTIRTGPHGGLMLLTVGPRGRR
jgi:hypothetical protein